MTLKPLAFAFFIFGFAAATYAQAVASQAVTKDPQAVALLTQSLNAAGGLSAIGSIQDFTGTGTITYNWAGEPVQAPVTVRGMGISNFRLDASLPNGTRTLAVSGYSGVLITPDGTRTSLGYYNFATVGSMTIPNVRIAAALTDSTTSISYLGAVSFNGGQAIQIHFAANDPNFAGVSSLSSLGTFDLYVDPTSSLVIALTETGHSDSNFTSVYMHEIDFSNYQASGNVVAPYTITEKIGGQATWSITLSSVSFNSGLTASTFTP
jgi:hypothetical protein